MQDRNLALEVVRITEAAALASARLMGRGDRKLADHVAVEAMRVAFDAMDIRGTVVIGEGERDEAPMLYIGERVGAGWRADPTDSPKVDIAVDPLEGTNLCATGAPDAISVIAIADDGQFLNAPDTYMEKLAVGPECRGVIDLRDLVFFGTLIAFFLFVTAVLGALTVTFTASKGVLTLPGTVANVTDVTGSGTGTHAIDGRLGLAQEGHEIDLPHGHPFARTDIARAIDHRAFLRSIAFVAVKVGGAHQDDLAFRTADGGIVQLVACLAGEALAKLVIGPGVGVEGDHIRARRQQPLRHLLGNQPQAIEAK